MEPWIKVSDAMPKTYKAVLVWWSGEEGMYVGYYAGGNWYVYVPDGLPVIVENINAWMPLPGMPD